MTSSRLEQMQANLTLAYVLNNAAVDGAGRELKHPTASQVKKIIVDRLNRSKMTRNDRFEIAWGPAIVLDPNGEAANVTVVVQLAGSGEYTVVTSGTNFTSPLDVLSDFSYDTLEPFSAYVPNCPSDARISAGTNGALYHVLKTPDESHQTLVQFLSTVPPSSVLNVVGHSLGGALASAIVLYLKNQSGLQSLTYHCQTFAAPTAGNKVFADYFDEQMRGNAVRIFTTRDIVPMAWNADSLQKVKHVYSDVPPHDTPDNVKIAVDMVSIATNSLKYTQWGTSEPSGPVATAMEYPLKADVNKAILDFQAQVGYQHIDGYIACLGMARSDIDLPPLPQVNPKVGKTPV
ncbi:lipase [Burkholderia ambifaria]|uniref:lipase family protein n=1 Tax=Burkholderia ambifaria TaxID=152480 RepID=UPI001B9751B1|nr:lipase [Burkholderia ambifaria]MBR8334189.1 lipase [Burkholderia ambifaria]